MKNKILGVVILILLPISIYVVKNKKEEIILNEDNKDIMVSLNYNNELLLLSLDDYLIGVVGAEMPASFNYEALKAQAIASRTFLLSNGINDVINTTVDAQAYKSNEDLLDKWKDNYSIYYNKIYNAVKETKDLVMVYEDNIIKSYYYAISNGYTEDSLPVFNEEHPYLNVVDSTFDENVNNFMVEVNFTKEEFCNKLNITCEDIVINDISYDESKRVNKIIINNKEFSGVMVRKALGLRSTDFNIELGEKIKISTRGYGHGVGMSQYGANYLANHNYNYDDILKYYYKDIKIKNISIK